MPLHVEQLTADAAEVPGIHTTVGDVRDLDLPERALRECARIVRPGGPVLAAAISRWDASAAA